jgi:hypothetical protein
VVPVVAQPRAAVFGSPDDYAVWSGNEIYGSYYPDVNVNPEYTRARLAWLNPQNVVSFINSKLSGMFTHTAPESMEEQMVYQAVSNATGASVSEVQQFVQEVDLFNATGFEQLLNSTVEAAANATVQAAANATVTDETSTLGLYSSQLNWELYAPLLPAVGGACILGVCMYWLHRHLRSKRRQTPDRNEKIWSDETFSQLAQSMVMLVAMAADDKQLWTAYAEMNALPIGGAKAPSELRRLEILQTSSDFEQALANAPHVTRRVNPFFPQ